MREKVLVAAVEEEDDGAEFNKFSKALKKLAPRPKWGQVYNYGEMHGDLLDGFFPSETCVKYYEFVDQLEAARGDDQDSGDDGY